MARSEQNPPLWDAAFAREEGAIRAGPPLPTCRLPGAPRLGIAAVALVVTALLVVEVIAEGVSDAGRHWAFQPVQHLPPPAVPSTSTNSSANPVDAWIRSGWADRGLLPSPEADRATLMRRVSFVLLGLPPTPEAVESFVADPAPDAYARMVERALASPRYGERWAQHWLEAAGYADSNGYFNADTDRPLAYRYRDYVIRSLNRDTPFDRFVQEQMAGDELSGWRPGEPVTPEIIELLEATHFLRNGQDGSGESDGNPDEVRVDRYYALEGAVQIIGSSLLGMTFQCAKCHDHKFEPVTQRDYYALQAVLYPAFHIDRWVKPNDRVVEAHLPGVLEAWTARKKDLDAEEAGIHAAFAAWCATNRPDGKVLFADGFGGEGRIDPRWTATVPGDDQPAGSPPVRIDSEEAPGAVVKDGVLRLHEGGGSGDRWLSTRQVFDWRPQTPGGWIEATFDLIAVQLGDAGRPADRIGYVIGAHDFNDNGTVAGGNLLIDGHPSGATQVHADYPGPDSKSLGDLGPTRYQAGHRYGVRITAGEKGRFTLQHVTDGVVDGKGLQLGAEDLPPGAFAFEYCCGRSFVVDNVRIETSDDTNPEWVRLQSGYEGRLAERRQRRDRESAAIQARRSPRPDRIAWMTDVGPEAPTVPLLKRGSPKTPGEAVEPDVPGFLRTQGRPVSWTPPTSGARTTGRRLAWVRWLTEAGSPQAALLARVTVNRIWQAHFGEGLVSTPDNLGLSGALPNRPELLEALSGAFIDSGWSLKALHRLILQSATFRQSSIPTPETLSRDPGNALWTRYPIHRLDAEAIRDAMISVAGVLHPKGSGPYVPTPRRGDGEVVEESVHPEALARSVFLQHRRTQVPTLLGNFDAPSVVFNCTRRASTTMPLQALTLLNSDSSRARASDLARRLDVDVGSGDLQRIQRAFLLTCGRPPDSFERESLGRFLDRQRALHGGQPEAEVRVWTDLCQSLLGLNAFLYLE
ncbi:MAG: DUF1549 and DUF1553 domain-containing protein [Limisphaerales bacterium]